MTGIKHDQGKPPFELIDPWALEGLARVLAFGAEKYSPDNWRAGLDWRRVIGSMERHLAAIKRGEDIDPESRLPHVDHVGCNWMFLSNFMKLPAYQPHDDRWKPTASSAPEPERETRDAIVLPAGAREWLANGERSVASETIFQHLTGIPINRDRISHPRDAADFRRCQLLLEQVPEFYDRLREMEGLSTAWSRLVNSWSYLEDLLVREAPDWRDQRGIAPALNECLAEMVGP